MNRLMQWVMAAALICSSTVFTSCMNEDNPVGPTDNLAEKLIGKWMDYEADGQPALTTGKMQWKALHAKEDGTTFEQTVDWERVEE